MKFGLKTMLVVVAVLGAVFGLMGKLLLENPEAFFSVLRVSSAILPFLLAIGTIAWIGLRRQPFQSRPICAGCKHDLPAADVDRAAACPSCNADLRQLGAMQYLCDRGRRWRLVAWAGALLLTPVIMALAIEFLLPSGNPLRVMASRRLIQKRLPSQVDSPWIWRELEYRLQNGTIDKEEVNEAAEELIAHMKRTRPAGWNQPLHWQRNFLQAAAQADMISDEVFIKLCDAFFGPQPIVPPLANVSDIATGFQLEVRHGNVWGKQSGLGVELLWDVKQVLLDGAPVTPGQVQKFGETWSARCDEKPEPGDHKVTFEIECAYIPQSKLAGLNTNNLPIQQWPKARKRWTTTVVVPLKVDSPTTP